MSSQEQIEANRRNGQLSKGPTTLEGKEASSKNALKHGLLSREILLPKEDASALAEFSQRLWAALNPMGELEFLLVDRIIALGWRLQRLGQIEAGILGFWIQDASDRGASSEAATLTYGLAFAWDNSHGKSLSNLSRYESRMERSLFRSLHELQRLQAARNGEHVPAPQAIDIDVTGLPKPTGIENQVPPSE